MPRKTKAQLEAEKAVKRTAAAMNAADKAAEESIATSASKKSGKRSSATRDKFTTTPLADEPGIEHSESGLRRFTLRSFRNRRKRRKAERGLSRTYVTNVFVLMGRSVLMIRGHWEIFGGIFLIHLLLNILLVGGFTDSSRLTESKQGLIDANDGQLGPTALGLSLFSTLVASGAGASGGASLAYQSILLLIVSLSIIWALRKLYAGSKIRIRDAFYNSSYPLVQSLLVILMVCIQVIPALLSVVLINYLLLNGIIYVVWQQLIVGVLCLLLLGWSAYLLSASLLAAYIVTLQDMTPLEALRSAKRLVNFRRAMVIRKMLFLPVTLLFVIGIIMVPLAVLATPVAPFVFYVLSLAAVPVVHAYMYMLYRELIRQ